MKRHKRIFLIAALIFALLSVVLSSACQEVYIPEMPTMNSPTFTISVSINMPAGVRKIQWQVTQGSATLINSDKSTVTVSGAKDGAYRFDVFVTDNNGAVAHDWVPVTVSGSIVNPEPPTVPPTGYIVRDTIKIFIDTCKIDYTKFSSLQFVLLLPEEGGKYILPDSTTIYQAQYGVAPPYIRLKDDASLRVYRFTRNYTINKVSTPIRFTLYKSGAWIREIKDKDGIWQIFPYAPY